MGSDQQPGEDPDHNEDDDDDGHQGHDGEYDQVEDRECKHLFVWGHLPLVVTSWTHVFLPLKTIF